MITDSDYLRYETKFVASPIERPTLDRWIRTHPAGFWETYPIRRVNSIYFDDWDFSAYAENLSGVSERTKVRFRWYGDDAIRPNGTLELKCKRNRVGWKLSYPVVSLPLAGAPWREIIPALRRQLPPEARLTLDEHPQVVMINRYWRRYYQSQDGLVRITVDTDQKVYDQRHSARPEIVREVNIPDAVILELKGAVEDRERLESAMQGLPIRVSRHSKYMVAVHAIGST